MCAANENPTIRSQGDARKESDATLRRIHATTKRHRRVRKRMIGNRGRQPIPASSRANEPSRSGRSRGCDLQMLGDITCGLNVHEPDEVACHRRKNCRHPAGAVERAQPCAIRFSACAMPSPNNIAIAGTPEAVILQREPLSKVRDQDHPRHVINNIRACMSGPCLGAKNAGKRAITYASGAKKLQGTATLSARSTMPIRGPRRSHAEGACLERGSNAR